MKTSLELSENLFRRAKALARKRGTTLRSLIEEGLRKILSADHAAPTASPKILTFGGEGFADSFPGPDLSWNNLRGQVYPE